MEQKVVNIPFVGGINEFDDPDQLPPPELVQCDNAVVRRPGRIEKRHGMTLVEGATGVPATAFGGTVSAPSGSVEAIEAYYGENGTRAVMAAGNMLYEYVGTDAAHGWRSVNSIPSYVGTLHGVAASGGTIIETETVLVQNNTKRVTVWVSGSRTGQELSSDLVYGEQTIGDGNSVYYAVQDVESGSFIKPPTRIMNAIGGYTTSATNLKMTVLKDAFAVEVPLIAWRKSGGGVEYCLLNPSTGALTATQSPFTYLVPNCHRAFDVVACYSGSAMALFAFCQADSASDSTPSKLAAKLVQFNTATGAITSTIRTLTNISYTTAPGSTEWYCPWAFRGVVLENDPVIVAGTEWVPFAARTVSRYYSAVSTATSQLDGQIVVGRLAVTSSNMTVGAYYANLPFIGFQTADDHSQVLALPVGGQWVTGAASINEVINSQWIDGSGSYRPDQHTVVLTGQLSDGTKQAYGCQIGLWASNDNTEKYSITSLSPYLALEAATDQISAFGYPLTTHVYAGDAPITATISANQANFIDVATAGSVNSGWDNGVFYNCVLKSGTSIVVSNCVVYVASHQIVQIAIVDGTSTATPPGAPTTPVNITSVVGITGGGTFSGVHAYYLLVGAVGATSTVITDVPDRLARPSPITSYAQGRGTGLEHCVHRWSVSQDAAATSVILAVSSTSANTVTTPSGDEQYGAADPHAKNNFFEVYNWPASSNVNLLNIADTGGTTAYAAAALGGPWRMIGSLTRSNGKLLCAITPSGDDGQRNTFLINIGTGAATMAVTQPGRNSGLETALSSSQSFVYSGNVGMFVESCNMMRVTAVPLNTPRLSKTATVATLAGLRDGSSKGTESVFAIDYEDTSQNWRKMQVFSDYTFINGGVPSVFDGVGCNEITSLVWPQKDLTSINWPWQGQDVYIADQNNTNPASATTTQPNAFWNRGGNGGRGGYFLANITKPYFKYEAGFLDKNGVYSPSLGCAWEIMVTNWGGDPYKNYETVYTDQRITSFNRGARGSYAFRLSSSGKFTHYYGRYQNNVSGLGGAHEYFPLANTALWVWAPRSSTGWDKPEMSRYAPEDAGGDFLMRWCYEYTDGTGRMARSAPSATTVFTVCAEIQGAPWSDDSSQVPGYMGGAVSVFKYGFFVPQLELTNRLVTAADDARRVVLQPYTTAEPYSTVLYRMPFSNFDNPMSNFVVSRNSTRGVVQWAGGTFDGSQDYPLGLVTNNLTCFDGPTKSYNGILSEPYLYTTGNVLDNVPPPSAKAMCVHQNRLVLGGADDPTVVWFSKQITSTDGPGFNDQMTITIGDGGPVMGLASLNGNLVVFKYQDVYVVPGTLPDDSGYGPSLGEPFNLPAGVGCIDHRSVVETPAGVFFQSARGLELLTPALDVVPMTKVRETLQTYPHITNAAHYPANREVWFVCHQTLVDAEHPTPAASVLVFNYQTSTWSKFDIGQSGYLGRGMFQIALVGQDIWMACSNTQDYADQAFAYVYDTTKYYDTKRLSAKQYVKVSLQTAPISLNNVQGFQRIKRMRLLGTMTPPLPGAAEYFPVQLGVLTDYKESMSNAQNVNWTQAQVQSVASIQGRAQFEIHVREQKGQKISFSFTEGTPSSVGATGFGMALSNLAVVVGLKSGLDKRITTEAKH